VYTEYRPTPLQHYVFPAGGDGIHLVVDENVSNLLRYILLLILCDMIQRRQIEFRIDFVRTLSKVLFLSVA